MEKKYIKPFVYLWAITLLVLFFAQVYCYRVGVCCNGLSDFIKHASFVTALMFLGQWSIKSFRNSAIAENEKEGVSKSILNWIYALCVSIIWVRVLWALVVHDSILATASIVVTVLLNGCFTFLLIFKRFHKK